MTTREINQTQLYLFNNNSTHSTDAFIQIMPWTGKSYIETAQMRALGGAPRNSWQAWLDNLQTGYGG